jgi:hypothetical protein
MSSDSIVKRVLEKGSETFLRNKKNLIMKYEFGYWQKVQEIHSETNQRIGKTYKEFIVLKRFFFYDSAEKYIFDKDTIKASSVSS